MKKIYIVYHGWINGEEVGRFTTKKKAIDFIKSQEWPEDYCYEVEKEG